MFLKDCSHIDDGQQTSVSIGRWLLDSLLFHLEFGCGLVSVVNCLAISCAVLCCALSERKAGACVGARARAFMGSGLSLLFGTILFAALNLVIDEQLL